MSKHWRMLKFAIFLELFWVILPSDIDSGIYYIQTCAVYEINLPSDENHPRQNPEPSHVLVAGLRLLDCSSRVNQRGIWPTQHAIILILAFCKIFVQEWGQGWWHHILNGWNGWNGLICLWDDCHRNFFKSSRNLWSIFEILGTVRRKQIIFLLWEYTFDSLSLFQILMRKGLNLSRSDFSEPIEIELAYKASQSPVPKVNRQNDFLESFLISNLYYPFLLTPADNGG